jgi:hypothetical protein
VRGIAWRQLGALGEPPAGQKRKGIEVVGTGRENLERPAGPANMLSFNR